MSQLRGRICDASGKMKLGSFFWEAALGIHFVSKCHLECVSKCTSVISLVKVDGGGVVGFRDVDHGGGRRVEDIEIVIG